MFNRAEAVDENFKKYVTQGHFPEARSHIGPIEAGLSLEDLIDLFESQVMSRHLDLRARNRHDDIKEIITC